MSNKILIVFFLLAIVFSVQKTEAQTQPFFGNDIFNKDTNGLVKAPLTNNGSKVLVDSGWVTKASFLTGVSVTAPADSIRITGDTISIKNSNSITLPRATIIKTTTTQANTSLTPINVNSLQFNYVAGNKYKIKIYLIYNSASINTGISLKMNAFSGNIYYSFQVDNSNAGVQAQAGFNNVTLFTSTASAVTTGNVAVINADLEATANGTFSFQFGTETNGNAITIQPNSRMEIMPVF